MVAPNPDMIQRKKSKNEGRVVITLNCTVEGTGEAVDTLREIDPEFIKKRMTDVYVNLLEAYGVTVQTADVEFTK